MALLAPVLLKLPRGFASWAEVIADSAASRAFPRKKLPPCLAYCPELAAPLVREVGAILRKRVFERRVIAARLLEAQLTEVAFSRAGGEEYAESWQLMEHAQNRFLALYHEPDSPDRQTRHAEMIHAQGEYERLRSRHARSVRETIAEAFSAHWKAQPMWRVPDAIFADVDYSSAPSRLARIHPVWWGRFFGQLQGLFGKGHPAHGEFLDALPRLTRNTGRCTIDGAIYEWRKVRNNYWGWYREENHRILADRAKTKAVKLIRWYRSRAARFLVDAAEQQRLHAMLAERLADADPWSVPMATWQDQLHGPN